MSAGQLPAGKALYLMASQQQAEAESVDDSKSCQNFDLRIGDETYPKNYMANITRKTIFKKA